MRLLVPLGILLGAFNAASAAAAAAARMQIVDLPLEHAFGSGPFTRTGQMTGEFSLQAAWKGAVKLERDDWSAAEQAAFAAIVNADDFYRVRIAATGGAYVVASVRARCLQAADFKEVVSLAVGTDGSVTGLQYSTPLRSCQAGMAVAAKVKVAAGPAQHCPLAVAVDVPREAAPIVMAPLDQATAAATGQPLPPWLMGEQQAERLKQYLAQQQQGRVSRQGGGPQQTSRPGGKKAADARKVDKDGKTVEGDEGEAPPEKSFIQQNWWFLIPVGIVVFNSLGRIMPDPT